MRDRNPRIKRGMVLLLTLALMGNGMSHTMLTALAKEEAAQTNQTENALENQATVQVKDQEVQGDTQAAADDMKSVLDNTEEIQKKSVQEKEVNDIGADGKSEEFYVEGTVSAADADLPNSDELFEGYIDKLFFGDLNGGISLFGGFGAKKLQGESLAIYNELKTWIQKVASGDSGLIVDSNIPTVKKLDAQGLTVTLSDSEASLGEEEIKSCIKGKVSEKMNVVLNYLLMDDPYDFYWFDKTDGMNYRYSYTGGNKTYNITAIEISFAVSSDFSPLSSDVPDEGTRRYLVDSGRILHVQNAVNKAKEIVNQYKNLSDYEKLAAYCREICGLTSYAHYAADDKTTSYGNPWQLISVFDGDEETNVVCEGYSKAFQYLCDLSAFHGNTVCCYTVTGGMDGGTGAGRHMWNIVAIEGKNYLVDVTNCDDGAVGAPDKLFLAGTGGSVAAGYTFNFGSSIKYTYDSDQESLFSADILTLADKNYTPKASLDISLDPVEVTYGDAVDPALLKGAASAGGGTEVKGTFSWAYSLTSFGVAGKKELKALFTPEDTGVYSPQTVSVQVTVKQRPITVKADAKRKTYGESDPELSYSLTGGTLVAGDSLAGSLARDAGEDVKDGGYAITQGTLTDVNNPNYQIIFIPGTFTIDKAVYSGVRTGEKSTKFGNSDQYELASMLPEGAKLGPVEIQNNAFQIFAQDPVLAGTVLSYTMDSDREKITKQATIKVPVTETRNYEPFDIVITVTLSDKLIQTDFQFDTADVKKVYGDSDFTIAAKNAVRGSAVTYTSSDPAIAQADAASGKVHILKKGSVTITASASETDDYAGKAVTYTLTVSPKALAWDVSGLYATDKQGEVQNKKASLYGALKLSGILPADAAKLVFNCPASMLSGTYADTEPGRQKVALTWVGQQTALEGEGADNYTVPAALPELVGKINAVTEQENVPESTETTKYKLEVEDGISQVPDTLKGIDSLDTPAKIETRMEAEVKKAFSSSGGQSSVEVYDVVLMVNKDNGGWEKATPDNFPEGGITVTLPYLEGTGKDTHNFAVAHMFTVAMNGKQPGDVEQPAVTKTDAGIQFKVTSLSPIGVGAQEIPSNASGSGAGGSNANNSASGSNSSPRTGDENAVLLYVLLMIFGAVGTGFAVKRKMVR